MIFVRSFRIYFLDYLTDRHGFRNFDHDDTFLIFVGRLIDFAKVLKYQTFNVQFPITGNSYYHEIVECLRVAPCSPPQPLLHRVVGHVEEHHGQLRAESGSDHLSQFSVESHIGHHPVPTNPPPLSGDVLTQVCEVKP